MDANQQPANNRNSMGGDALAQMISKGTTNGGRIVQVFSMVREAGEWPALGIKTKDGRVFRFEVMHRNAPLPKVGQDIKDVEFFVDELEG